MVGMRLSYNYVNVCTIAYRVHVYTRASLIHSPNPNPASSNRIHLLSLLNSMPRSLRPVREAVSVRLSVSLCAWLCGSSAARRLYYCGTYRRHFSATTSSPAGQPVPSQSPPRYTVVVTERSRGQCVFSLHWAHSMGP